MRLRLRHLWARCCAFFWLYGTFLLEEAGAAGDVQLKYGTLQTLTVTNLQSLASSASHVAGWESGAIDNSSDSYEDFSVNAKIVVAAASLAAGEIRMYLVAEQDDSTFPDVFDGTEGAETVTDTEVRDAICVPAGVTATDTTGSRTYYLRCGSVAAAFEGNLPRKFVVFITQSTTQALASSGNAVYVKPSYRRIAQS